MSKTIKVEDKVYHRLDELREKRETFSEVVQRLLDLHVMLTDVSKVLGPGHYLHDVKQYRENQEAAAKR
ncbi:hypothetical protein ES703_108471 [subsurface metagenome]